MPITVIGKPGCSHEIKVRKFYTYQEIQKLIKEKDIQNLSEYKFAALGDPMMPKDPKSFYPKFKNAQNFFRIAIMTPDQVLKEIKKRKTRIGMAVFWNWVRNSGIKHLPRNPRVAWTKKELAYFFSKVSSYVNKDMNGFVARKEKKASKKAYGSYSVFTWSPR